MFKSMPVPHIISKKGHEAKFLHISETLVRLQDCNVIKRCEARQGLIIGVHGLNSVKDPRIFINIGGGKQRDSS